jgi:hypothetical protein
MIDEQLKKIGDQESKIKIQLGANNPLYLVRGGELK